MSMLEAPAASHLEFLRGDSKLDLGIKLRIKIPRCFPYALTKTSFDRDHGGLVSPFSAGLTKIDDHPPETVNQPLAYICPRNSATVQN